MVLLGLLLPAAAQDPYLAARPAMRVYAEAAGLPGDSVYDLMLDRKGQLWAGTLEGPARFSAGGWTALTLPPEATSQHVRALLEARDGSLWIGTQGGGLWHLDQGRWQHVGAAEGLPASTVNCLMETEEGGRSVIWAGTAGGGIARFSEGRWTLTDRERGLRDPWIWKLRAFQDPDGQRRIWAAARDGLWTLRGEAWKQMGPAEGFQATSANDLVEMPGPGGRCRVWVSCWGSGLACWDGTRWEHLGPDQGFPSRFPTSLAVAADAAGRPVLWAGTFDAGIAWLEEGHWQRCSPAQGFPVVGAYALLALPGGRPTLWAGTRGAGVVAVDLGGWRTQDARSGLPSAEVTSFATFPTSGGGTPEFWVGTTRGLARWGGDHWITSATGNGPAASYIFHLATARDGRGMPTLWAGTLGGLLRYGGGRWVPETDPALPKASANVLLETESTDGTGTLWVGFSAGLARHAQGRWSLLTMADGLPGNWVIALCATRDRTGGDSLWVGTRGQGVGRWHGGRWTVYGSISGLPALNVPGLVATRGSDGRTWVWAGTQGGGLARLEADRPGAIWEPIPLGEGSRSIVGVRVDAAGRLYLGTTRGVFRCRLVEHAGVPWPEGVEHFSTGDGLPTNTIQTNALYQDQEGRVWVGTARGAAVLDPRRERPLPPMREPELEWVEVAGRRRLPGPELAFTHRDTRLVFRFGLQAFHRREDTAFRSRIDGLEAEPTAWTASNARELTGLPAGRYRLELWARDFAGRISGPVGVPFTVAPAPWRSAWAYGCYGAGLLLAMGVTIRTRTALLRRRQRILAAQVRAALAEVRTLQGLLPICAYCKKIRDDRGAWEQLEAYLTEHSKATFSHGICPDCREKLKEELDGRG